MENEYIEEYIEIIRSNSGRLEPQKTGLSYINRIRHPIKACIFDVYGTLFISGSGDIGADQTDKSVEAYTRAFSAAGFSIKKEGLGHYISKQYFLEIKKQHTELRSEGIDYPEIDIRTIWQELCKYAVNQNYIDPEYTIQNIYRLAVEFETRVNPVWPMGDAAVLFSNLTARGIVLGIVSNAQFYTPLLFPALLGSSLTELGFSEDFCVWSYRSLRAKPSVTLFSPLVQKLRSRFGIEPHEILYVGNDILNDVYTAKEAGCSTCLFAGDLRSLRLRKDHPGCKDIISDAIVISLDQIGDLLYD